MRQFGTFLTGLRKHADISQDELAAIANTNTSIVSRLEKNEISQPFKGPIRKIVLTLGETLCTTRQEMEQYLKMAEIDRTKLTEVEELQLGYLQPSMQYTQNEQPDREALKRWGQFYEQRIRYLELRQQHVESSTAHLYVRLKIQEYTSMLQIVEKRLYSGAMADAEAMASVEQRTFENTQEPLSKQEEQEPLLDLDLDLDDVDNAPLPTANAESRGPDTEPRPAYQHDVPVMAAASELQDVDSSVLRPSPMTNQTNATPDWRRVFSALVPPHMTRGTTVSNSAAENMPVHSNRNGNGNGNTQSVPAPALSAAHHTSAPRDVSTPPLPAWVSEADAPAPRSPTQTPAPPASSQTAQQKKLAMNSENRPPVARDASEKTTPSVAAPVRQAEQSSASTQERSRPTIGSHNGEEHATGATSLLSLASRNARWLMQQAGVKRFAVDDCITLAQSRNYEGWGPKAVSTTMLSTALPLPEEVEKVRQEHLPTIVNHYYNGAHYRLLSFTPSFSARDQIHVTLAPIHFYDYYSTVLVLDEPLLQGAEGTKLSIRQRYASSALSYSVMGKGVSQLPAPISLHCIVVTRDKQIITMQRSSWVGFYPGRWSVSCEEMMNAPDHEQDEDPTRAADTDFFATARRCLFTELGIPAEAIEQIRLLSLNIEYLTLSATVIALVSVGMAAEEVEVNWMLRAWHRDEAANFATLSTDLHVVIEALLSKMAWHPTARMRMLQFLFACYGIDAVERALHKGT